MATATATMDASQSLMQTESYHYSEVSETRQTKKKKSRRHKEEGTISVSKSSEKLHKKLKAGAADNNPQCSACSRPVFAMERVQAERRAWHKECFRCAQCNKQLTVETYQSDHTTLYCKPHFKQLFEPKPVDGDDDTDAAPKKHQMIICESNPVELPPDVVRASDKPDLGLEELSQLDVKSRFEVFERKNKDEPLPAEPRAPREKSSALLSKLAKFKAKGMDVGVSDEYLNGVPVEASSSEPEDEEDDEDSVLKKSYRHTNGREHAVALHNMSELLGRWESGAPTASDRRRDTKQEIQEIRSRLFMGKQAKIKEMYEQSVLQSEQGVTSAEKIAQELDLDAEKARAIKERFESGQVFNDENQPPKNREIDDSSLFREGIGKKSRSIFLELDANAKHVTPAQPQEPPKRKEIPFIPKDVVRAADKVEDVHIETADISDRFKFFETYKPAEQRKEFRMTPPRTTQRPKSPSPEMYVDEAVARAGAGEPAPDTHTASRMISVFRLMEENCTRPDDRGPKPLKRFTPPPPGESNHHGDSSDYSDDDSDEDEPRAARQPDEALQQAQQLARTTSFRDRFEKWTEPARPEPLAPSRAERAELDDDGESQLETAKSLREKFENLKVQQSNVSKTFAPKVNRFV